MRTRDAIELEMTADLMNGIICYEALTVELLLDIRELLTAPLPASAQGVGHRRHHV